MTTVLATGSTADPLISRSYLEGAFQSALKADIDRTLTRAADDAISRLDKAYIDYLGYDFAPSFTPITLFSGDVLTLPSGSSYILISGEASISIATGIVLDIATGAAAESGSRLTQYRRYFCVEETSASITFSTEATGHVDGYFHVVTAADKPPVSELPFIDVPVNAWYYNAVRFVYESELFRGTSNTTFSPAASMTRAMFVTVLHRLEGLPEVEAEGGFSDVADPNAYYYTAVAWASSNEIVNGYGGGIFLPDRVINREEMATIMYRYARYNNHDISFNSIRFNTFIDRADVSAYAADPFRWGLTWNIVGGVNGRLLPQNVASRAEVAQTIFNYCENLLP